MGSFRPGAGNQHLHWYFNFTGCIVETALKSRLSAIRSTNSFFVIGLGCFLVNDLCKGVSPIYYHNTDNSRLELDFVIQRNAQMVK